MRFRKTWLVKFPQVVAFIAGATVPSGKRMGHAGAIIRGSSETAQDKIAALVDAGATVVTGPADIGINVKKVPGN